MHTRNIFENYAAQHPHFRVFLNDETARREFRIILSLAAQREAMYSSNGLTNCIVDMLEERIRKFEFENQVSTDPLVLPFHYMLELVGLKRRPRNLFCGAMAVSLDEQELAVALAKQEVTEYAFAENWAALSYVMWNDRKNVYFNYNPDIRYYLQLLLTKLSRAEWVKPETTRQIKETNAPLMLPLEELSPQRRKFVEDAFERGDYQAVVNTTDPC